ncbi:PREDICTED: probable cytochrome P450 49a1 isoform X2 [Ceratosolen solmsi marchali]|uniref:Probable cytochrome P450 49a1 isoform X2 n=1 Tax=Ceratosolen solmsi marchali TaxID=326594 RepID=A0AAJ7DY90_9HYME|nr:PREDICTED: probable cytochrome P450 49a1 isoform X2 [Ceratosolen solmsi marchali]
MTTIVGRFARTGAVTSTFGTEPTTTRMLRRMMETLATDVGRIRPYAEMPGPTPIPFLGNTWRFIPFIGNFKIHEVDKVSRRLYEEYGDIVKVEGLLNRPDMVFVYDADEIERIFRQEERMPHRPKMPSLDYYKHVLRKDIFNENPGVIAVHGEGWYNFRSKVQQVMLQPRTARMYTETIDDASRAFIERIEKIKDEKDEVPENFLNEIHKWSLESIARVALDVRLGCLDEEHAPPEIQQLINAVLVFFKNVGVLELKIPFWKFFNTPTWRKYISALDVILSTTSKFTELALERSKLSTKTQDKLSLLERVLASEGNTQLATVLAFDLFLVGIDTTSNSVASVLYQLALHPDKQEMLHDEMRRVLGETDQITTSHINELKYLKACIKETQRMFPVVIGNGRCMTSDTIISGYHVPKGVHVVFQHYVISNTERYFPGSDRFLPERWIDSGGLEAPRHAFASLPFGYGRRMCLGRRFAELEILVVLSKVFQKYRVEYHYEKLDYYIDPMYTPKGPLKFKFIKR